MEVILSIIGMIAVAVIVILIIAFAMLVFGGVYLQIKQASKSIDIAARNNSPKVGEDNEKNRK